MDFENLPPCLPFLARTLPSHTGLAVDRTPGEAVPSGRLCGQVGGGYRLTIGVLSLPDGYLIGGAFPAAVNTNNLQ